MAAYFPNVGRKLTLDIVLNAGRNPKLKLFKNNVTLDPTMLIGQLDKADFDGYADIDLTALSAAAIDADGKGFKELLACNFTRTTTGTAQTIYGWYIVIDNLGATEELWILRKFSAPVLVELAGHFVEFDLRVRDNLGS